MKSDSLTRYVQLHSALVKEKAALEQRLTQINKALDGSGQPVAPFAPMSSRATVLVTPSRRGGARPRLDNPMPLREAMIRATSPKPLAKPDILTAVKKLGYKFAGKDPMNSINVQLYTKGQFRKHPGGKFSPAKVPATK